VLREFASNKRQVKLSRVTVRTKDEDEDVKPASKHLAAPVATSESARNPRGHSPRYAGPLHGLPFAASNH
jgi:hypothetical protein